MHGRSSKFRLRAGANTRVVLHRYDIEPARECRSSALRARFTSPSETPSPPGGDRRRVAARLDGPALRTSDCPTGGDQEDHSEKEYRKHQECGNSTVPTFRVGLCHVAVDLIQSASQSHQGPKPEQDGDHKAHPGYFQREGRCYGPTFWREFLLA